MILDLTKDRYTAKTSKHKERKLTEHDQIRVSLMPMRVGVVVALNGCAWLHHRGNVADSAEEATTILPFFLNRCCLRTSLMSYYCSYCLAHRINKNKIPETKITEEGSPSRNITRKHDHDPTK